MVPGPVCVALTPRRVQEIFAVSLAGADCVEVRLDYLDDPQEAGSIAWARLPVPAIATCRGRERGGRFEGSIEDELGILERAAAAGARFVDIDFRFARPVGGAEVIASCHDFEQTVTDIESVLESVCRGPAGIAKIATAVRSWSDNRRLLELLDRRWPKPVIVVGMGEVGQITRVLGPSRGSALTYVSAGEAAAPGQMELGELLDVYRFRDIARGTRVTGIVGWPVGHSRSPELHNRAFDEAGLDRVYLKCPVQDLGDFFDHAGALGIEGFSVTIPHKVAIMRYLSGVTGEAAAVGAVNTVYRSGGQWMGDNTDVHGVREALKDVETAGKQVVILGTGGAARAAVAALEEAGTVTLLSRTREPGTLEWSRPVRVDRIENYGRYGEDLLINATPAGMFPDVTGCPLAEPVQADVVFDMVYNPAETRLLHDARCRGKRTIPGTAMFVAQAARQFEIWTGRPAPADVFRKALA